jgi:uncharacterized membrane protein YdbT with pleckstrin-like domain
MLITLIILKVLNLALPVHLIVFILILVFISALFEEPEVERIMRKYVITDNEIVKIEGILRKRRISVPYQSIANIDVSKGIVGRILNFGNIRVEIFGGKNDFILKGIKDPTSIQNIIENRIASLRKQKRSDRSK